jgi:hypothetical protein
MSAKMKRRDSSCWSAARRQPALDAIAKNQR